MSSEKQRDDGDARLLPGVAGAREGGFTAAAAPARGALARISDFAKAAALAASIVAAATAAARKGHKTPRPPYAMSDSPANAGAPTDNAGTAEGEDPCNPLPFFQDATPGEIAKPGEPMCKFVTDPDGKMHVIGHTLIDENGEPRDCFLTEPWAPNVAMKTRGEVYGLPNPDQQGKIHLENGKLCVTMLEEEPADAGPRTETIVAGEASLHIVTAGKFMVKKLEPELNKETGKMVHYVLVVPVEGQTLITQDGRKEQIILNKGDAAAKIPLDMEQPDYQGCYVASTTPCEADPKNGGTYLLAAGAIFLMLRKRKSG